MLIYLFRFFIKFIIYQQIRCLSILFKSYNLSYIINIIFIIVLESVCVKPII